MKEKLKQAAMGVLTALILILTLTAPVFAASKSSNDYYAENDWKTVEKGGITYYSRKVILTWYPNDKSYTDLYLDDYLCGGKIQLLNVQKNQYSGFTTYDDSCSALKTSDPSVATVKAKGDTIIVTPKKAGTTTITYQETYKDDDGSEVEKYSIKVIVKKYKNPFKSLKIAGKAVSVNKLKKNSVCTLSYKSLKNKKTKVSYKLANGWKVTEKSWYKLKAMLQTNKSVKKISGGKGFTFKFELENTKTGQLEDVEVVLK